ncbi:39S ribosomal protein L39, mitochondrial [Chrysoperla carnea]|uniref:39S ribosomal protein L39, mitochondrial n=1 Tax=Chrysoperla carnea TaxID=189513 RepID=UPI001D080087|nr:39S ribosomal protein L39, mitochondrial [Chrysoperla carnea]
MFRTFNYRSQPVLKIVVRNINVKIRRQNELFDLEKKRQIESVGRVEKIEVDYIGNPEQKVLTMNKDLSTPYNCAQHLGQSVINTAALALVDNQPWDMHRPLKKDCQIDFLHFESREPYILNKAFWRSCSFLLGAMATIAFKDNINLLLHSFPSPQVRSGSFVYDIDLGLEHWKPTPEELRVLSAEFIQFCSAEHKFERLDVGQEIAEEIFKCNKYKSAQIPDIAEQNEGKVTLYRVGHHIDISRGPMISNTNFVGRCSVASVHKILPNETLYRFQGVALPKTLILNHFAYRILEDRAKKLNQGRLPTETTQSIDENRRTVLA